MPVLMHFRKSWIFTSVAKWGVHTRQHIYTRPFSFLIVITLLSRILRTSCFLGFNLPWANLLGLSKVLGPKLKYYFWAPSIVPQACELGRKGELGFLDLFQLGKKGEVSTDSLDQFVSLLCII